MVDILIAYADEIDYVAIKRNISKKFKLIVSGNVKYFLEMEIEREGNTGAVRIGHFQYIDRVLLEHGMGNSIPLEPAFHCTLGLQIGTKKPKSSCGT